jgi:hypothetical protein
VPAIGEIQVFCFSSIWRANISRKRQAGPGPSSFLVFSTPRSGLRNQ